MSRSLQEKGVYGTWMFEEQDRIQAFARSFGERIVGEAFEEVLASDEVVGSDNEEILGKLFHLHLLASLERDLPWFMENGLLTPQEAEEVSLKYLILEMDKTLDLRVTNTILFPDLVKLVKILSPDFSLN